MKYHKTSDYTGKTGSPALLRGAFSDENFMVIAGILMLALALFRSGGFYTFVSAELNVLISLTLLAVVFIRRRLRLEIGLPGMGIGIVCLFHFLTGFWGTDSSMAFKGGIKFLPFFLFYLFAAQMTPAQKEKLLKFLPAAGAVQVLASLVLSRFETLKPLVMVDGRMGGLFQYPNTFAVFELVCVMLCLSRLSEVFRGSTEDQGKAKRAGDGLKGFFSSPAWLLLLSVICLLGIALSGSRTVYVLTAAAAVVYGAYLLVSRRKAAAGSAERTEKQGRRGLLPAILAAAVLFCLLLAVTGVGAGMLARIRQIGLSSSTLTGRILYDLDALRIIRDHPFGLGYYGYRFIQGMYKTGVYSVVNVHNELLQTALDTGLIPCLVMAGAMIGVLAGCRISLRNRFILTVLLLHALVDYDFQFIGMCFILILLLPEGKKKEIMVPSAGRALLAACAAGVFIASLGPGRSDLLYVYGRYAESEEAYPNTVSELNLLTDTDMPPAARLDLIRRIWKRNNTASASYAAAAQLYYADGDIASMVTCQKAAIRTDPYRYTLYSDYMTMLAEAADAYAGQENLTEARRCAVFAKEIPEMLEEIKKRTSPLAWRLSVQPVLELDSWNSQVLKRLEDTYL